MYKPQKYFKFQDKNMKIGNNTQNNNKLLSLELSKFTDKYLKNQNNNENITSSFEKDYKNKSIEIQLTDNKNKDNKIYIENNE